MGPFSPISTTLRRLALVLALLLPIAERLTCGVATVSLMNGARLDELPGASRALVVSSEPDPSQDLPEETVDIARRAAKEWNEVDRLRVLCQGLRELMPAVPRFSTAWSRPPCRPRTPRELWNGWGRGDPGDGLSVATLASLLATRAKLRNRVVLGSDGALLAPRSFASIEVYLTWQRGWILVDPWIGVAFHRPDRFLSLSGLQREGAGLRSVGVTALATPLPPSTEGFCALEYGPRLRELWVRTGQGPEPVWALADMGRPLSFRWKVAAWIGSANQWLDRCFSRGPASWPSRLAAALGAFYVALLAWVAWRGGEPGTGVRRLPARLGRELAADVRCLPAALRSLGRLLGWVR
ncbi:MAG: hypothetical protein HY814_14480 [Candidatus Riflebacteria bacterium]|nr:hypothetical protein [Candidatus Riflebacteria bacterium]